MNIIETFWNFFDFLSFRFNTCLEKNVLNDDVESQTKYVNIDYLDYI